MMSPTTSDSRAVIEFQSVVKDYGGTRALDGVNLSIPRGRVVGLVGRNGSGKTTLMRHVLGLALPTAGAARVLGRETAQLGDADLARIGAVHQEQRFLAWMRVAQHLEYVASFHARWDRDREQRLVRELELDPRARVGDLSPGNAQKLALVLATAHRPELCILDEPVSALDPIVRETLFAALLDILREDEITIVLSSHVLRDIERVVDHIVCLERGRVRIDSGLDELREQWTQWWVSARGKDLPTRFGEAFVLHHEGDRRQARLVVHEAAGQLERFRAHHDVDVECSPMNLERMFPLWVAEARR